MFGPGTRVLFLSMTPVNTCTELKLTDAAMLARSWDRNSVCLSVRPSVRLSGTEEHTADILIPHERV